MEDELDIILDSSITCHKHVQRHLLDHVAGSLIINASLRQYVINHSILYERVRIGF